MLAQGVYRPPPDAPAPAPAAPARRRRGSASAASGRGHQPASCLRGMSGRRYEQPPKHDGPFGAWRKVQEVILRVTARSDLQGFECCYLCCCCCRPAWDSGSRPSRVLTDWKAIAPAWRPPRVMTLVQVPCITSIKGRPGQAHICLKACSTDQPAACAGAPAAAAAAAAAPEAPRLSTSLVFPPRPASRRSTVWAHEAAASQQPRQQGPASAGTSRAARPTSPEAPEAAQASPAAGGLLQQRCRPSLQ